MKTKHGYCLKSFQFCWEIYYFLRKMILFTKWAQVGSVVFCFGNKKPMKWRWKLLDLCWKLHKTDFKPNATISTQGWFLFCFDFAVSSSSVQSSCPNILFFQLFSVLRKFFLDSVCFLIKIFFFHVQNTFKTCDRNVVYKF